MWPLKGIAGFAQFLYLGGVMTSNQNYLTPNGLKKLQAELDTLITIRRREVAEDIKRASEIGGTVDNAEYDEAKRSQSTVEGRIMDLELAIRDAVIIPNHTTPSETVTLGSQVALKDAAGKTTKYTIVGSMEADPAHGRISNASPVGQALLGKRVGDDAEVRAPAGVQKFTIVEIK
jgi:transcription elongation factor GreA